MPVLARSAKRFAASKVFKGHRVAMCLHLEGKTAVLAEVFLKAGAEVAISGSNPLSTPDDVAAALSETGVHVCAWRGVSDQEHASNLDRVLCVKPDLLIDDGAELSIASHLNGLRLVQTIIGACEEATTGVPALTAMARQGGLTLP